MKYDFLILGFGEVSSGWTNPQWMAYTLSKEKIQLPTLIHQHINK